MNSAMRCAVILALGFTPGGQADELGRLFFTPDERLQLDRQYARHTSINDQSGIIVNGLIQRSDGARTVWINGKAQANAPGKNTSAVPVTVPGKTEPIEVKVGQRLLLDNLPPSKTETQSTSKKGDEQ
jgi:hypothetical protein